MLFVSYSLIAFNFYLFYFPGAAAEHRLGTSGIRHTGLLTADIYHCCVYREKLLIMERGTVRNM